MASLPTEDAIEEAIGRYRLAIPRALQLARVWLLWRFEPSSKPGAKPLKVPHYVRGSRRSGVQGSPDDVAQLATFEEALTAFASGAWTGLGIAHVPGCGFVSLDFDGCVSAEGEYDPEIWSFIHECGTYVELSPSGRGIRVVARGTMASVKQITPGGNIELFGESGFVTITGRQICGEDVCELPTRSLEQLNAWLAGAAGEQHTRTDQIAQVRSVDPIYQHLKTSRAIKRDFTDGRSSIRCPFEAEHTGGSGFSDTVYFLPQTNGYARGHFKCLHAHCAQRTDADFTQRLGVPEIDVSSLLKPPGAAISAPAVHVPIDWVDVGRNPPQARRWAIEGWLGVGFMTLVAGRGGVGKTLILQQLASCLTLGRRFLGDSHPMRVLMWCAEDDADELKRRQLAIAEWLGVPIGLFKDRLIVQPLAGIECSLAELSNGALRLTRNMKLLWEQINDYGVGAFMLDNIAHLYGGNENDRYQVTQFTTALTGMCISAQATGALAGHPGKSSESEFSGSTAWENAVRGRLYLSRTPPDEKEIGADPQGLTRYLSKRKANYSALDCQQLTFQNGVLAPEDSQAGDGLIQNIRDKRACEVVLRAIEALKKSGVYGSASNHTANFLPKLVTSYDLAEGLHKSEIEKAMRRLMKDGRLAVGEVGRYANRSPRLGLVAR